VGKAGRAAFAARFFREGFDTVITPGHTTLGQGWLCFACTAMSEPCDGHKVCASPRFPRRSIGA
jgi:hypothetical protein